MDVVEVFDPTLGQWELVTELTTARYRFASVVANGKIYAIGGVPLGGGSTSSVEAYDPALKP